MASNKNETTTKFKVDISELKSAMQEAKRQVALANSEFKAVSSSMDNWSKSSDGISAKLKQLNTNLSSQKTVLAQYEKSLEEVKKTYGENSKEAQEWQVKVNNQQAVVNKTQQEIKKYEAELTKVSQAEKIASKSGKEVSEVLEETSKNSKKANDGFTIMKGTIASLTASAIKSAVSGFKKLGQTMLDTARSADDLNTQAKITSVDVQTLQEWNYASKFIDTSVDTMTGAMKKLTKNMSGDSKTVNSALKQLKVASKDANGQLRSSKDVFFDLIDALGKVENETQRDALAMTLFGKSATELNPLIEAGSDELNRLSKEAYDFGAVMDDDTVNSFNNLNDAVDRLKSTGRGVFAQLGKELLDSGAMDQFVAFMQDKAIPSIRDFVGWIIDNKGTVLTVISAIGAGFLSWKISSIASSAVTSLGGLITALISARTAQEGLNTAMKANVIGLIISLIATLVTAFITLWNTSEEFRNFFINMWDNIKKTVANVTASISNFFSGMWNSLVSGARSAWDSITSIFSKLAEFFGNIFGNAWQRVKDVFSTGGRIFDGIKDGIVSAFKAIVNGIIGGINKVVSLPFEGINWALNKIKSVNIMGLKPFDWIQNIGVPQIPYLYKGGVLKKGQVGFLEGNGDEAVVPLDKNTGWLDEVANRIVAKGGIANTQPQTINNNYNYEYNQTNNSPKALSRLDIYRQSKNLLGYVGGV